MVNLISNLLKLPRGSQTAAVTGLFDSPDDIAVAARRAVAAGYTRFDVHTPYPLHGMDSAMALKPSKLPWVSLVCAMIGLSFAFLLQWFSMGIDYPLMIGGKPHVPFPAFVIVMFELSVLFCAIGTVGSLIAYFCSLPSLSHTLQGTSYLRAATSSRFGLALWADDPKFLETEATRNLKEWGATDISTVQMVPMSVTAGTLLVSPLFWGVVLTTVLLSAGVTYSANHILVHLWPFNWMTDQFKVKSQMEHSAFADRAGNRKPVVGTIARGYLPYPFRDTLDQASRQLVNPLPATAQTLKDGQRLYLSFCSPCHGNHGDAASRLRGQFPVPPSFHSTVNRERTDGHLFHVITVGQNVMPGYEIQLSEDERWKIIHYIRALQRAKNPTDEDLKP